jgi:hypothetical protein
MLSCFFCGVQFRFTFGLGAVEFDGTACIRYYVYAGWSSLVARRAHNPEVVGSNPTPATNSFSNLALAQRFHSDAR